jgi:hypothetical protein
MFLTYSAVIAFKAVKSPSVPKFSLNNDFCFSVFNKLDLIVKDYNALSIIDFKLDE